MVNHSIIDIVIMFLGWNIHLLSISKIFALLNFLTLARFNHSKTTNSFFNLSMLCCLRLGQSYYPRKQPLATVKIVSRRAGSRLELVFIKHPTKSGYAIKERWIKIARIVALILRYTLCVANSDGLLGCCWLLFLLRN